MSASVCYLGTFLFGYEFMFLMFAKFSTLETSFDTRVKCFVE